jgi:hypothetical protein
MSKNQSSRKDTKKKPAKTKEEKRQAKRVKAEEKRPTGSLLQNVV